MTKQKTWKGIRICCYVALLFCIAWALFEVFMFVGLLTGKGGVDKAIDWSQENTSAKAVLLVVVLLFKTGREKPALSIEDAENTQEPVSDGDSDGE